MKKIKPYLLMMPVILLIFILLIGLLYALLQSFGYIKSLGLYEITLKYYREILSNEDFLVSFKLSMYISLVSSFISLLIGIIIAVAIVRIKRKRFYNTIIRIPIIIPHTIVALFVIAIFSQSGVLSRILYQMGFIENIKEFPNLIYNKWNLGVIFAYLWKQGPFVAYFIMSTLESISNTYEEAAINLGASPIKAFIKVTLPLLLPNIFSSFIIILGFSFAAYELPFLLGTTKPKALPIQAYIDYIHPDLLNRPYAMAQNGIIVIVSCILTFLFYILVKNRWKGINIDGKI